MAANYFLVISDDPKWLQTSFWSFRVKRCVSESPDYFELPPDYPLTTLDYLRLPSNYLVYLCPQSNIKHSK